MRWLLYAVIAVAVIARITLRRRKRNGHTARTSASFSPFTGDVGLVASREIRERIRGRIFRVGTILILLVVAAAIVIPTINKGKATPENVGVVGTLSSTLRADVIATGRSIGTTVKFVSESSLVVAHSNLKKANLDVVIVNGGQLLINRKFAASDGSTNAQFVPALAQSLGQVLALRAAHLSSTQTNILLHAKPLPISSLVRGAPKAKHPVSAASIIGLVLLFTMLSQYNTWILIGVMEEKSSRVVEVLLAAVRPIQLLAGKVLGIGAVAFAQAGLVVAFALILSKAIGSNFLHGTAPLTLASTLIWLALGFAFYCWVYAAAGSMAERQDQVQSLALPLSLPMIFGYIFSITAASSGSASLFFKVLAYFPPTAPFAMPILVSFGDVTWWQFAASAVISVASTFVVARFASNIYRRAILRTGRRVKFREALSNSSR